MSERLEDRLKAWSRDTEAKNDSLLKRSLDRSRSELEAYCENHTTAANEKLQK